MANALIGKTEVVESVVHTPVHCASEIGHAVCSVIRPAMETSLQRAEIDRGERGVGDLVPKARVAMSVLKTGCLVLSYC